MESGKGKAWLYFIFQWLPTNYRMNYFLDTQRKHCNLCLCNSLDTMDHLLQCPALAKEQILLKETVDTKFKVWDIPYSSTKSREPEICSHLRSAARKSFPASIPDFKLNLLSKGFYQVNRSKQFLDAPISEQFVKPRHKSKIIFLLPPAPRPSICADPSVCSANARFY